MRETCARALAAALMTGAIATAVGLPPAFRSASAPERGLIAPPSSLQSTVRIPAGTAREEPSQRADLPVVVRQAARSEGTRARDVHVNVRLVTRRPSSAPTRSPAPKPKPTRAPAPTPAPPSAEPPVAAPAPAPVPTDTTRELASAPPVVEPEAPPPPPPVTDEPEHDKGKEKDRDKDKEKEHEHGDGHGRGHDKED